MLYNDNMNMMMYRRKQQNGKVVIVDYDDTILPSTFVDRWQIENSKDLPQHVRYTIYYTIYYNIYDSALYYTSVLVAVFILSRTSFLRFFLFVKLSVSKDARRAK